MQEVLDKPVPIVFAVVQGIQQLVDRTLNLLSIYDKLIAHKLPDGTLPDSVTIQVVTIWTGGQGDFEQVIQVLDQDAKLIGESKMQFHLPRTSHRFYMVALINMPVRVGIFTLTVARGTDELLRQDFTVEVADFPGTAP